MARVYSIDIWRVGGGVLRNQVEVRALREHIGVASLEDLLLLLAPKETDQDETPALRDGCRQVQERTGKDHAPADGRRVELLMTCSEPSAP